MKSFFSLIFLPFRWAWKFLTIGAAIISSLFLLCSITLLLVLLFYHPKTEVPDGAALVLAPQGNIVEKKSALDPMTRVINNMAGAPLHEELQLQDIIDTIRSAASDDRIKLLVIVPDHLKQAGLNQ